MSNESTNQVDNFNGFIGYTVELPNNNINNSNMDQTSTPMVDNTSPPPKSKKPRKPKRETPELAYQTMFEINPSENIGDGHPIACVQCRSRHKVSSRVDDLCGLTHFLTLKCAHRNAIVP